MTRGIYYSPRGSSMNFIEGSETVQVWNGMHQIFLSDTTATLAKIIISGRAFWIEKKSDVSLINKDIEEIEEKSEEWITPKGAIISVLEIQFLRRVLILLKNRETGEEIRKFWLIIKDQPLSRHVDERNQTFGEQNAW